MNVTRNRMQRATAHLLLWANLLAGAPVASGQNVAGPSSGATRHLLPAGEGLAPSGPLPLGEGGSFDFAQDKLRPGEGALAAQNVPPSQRRADSPVRPGGRVGEPTLRSAAAENVPSQRRADSQVRPGRVGEP